jgi:tartrate-resistant acid phosphatase type 5
MKRCPALWALCVLLLLVVALAACSGSGPAAGTGVSTESSIASAGPGATQTTLAPSTTASTAATMASVPLATFAVIGDYGVNDQREASVASLVASWGPAYVLALGDNYYGAAGGTGTGKYDQSTGAYYGKWLKDITTTGTRLPKGLAAVNAFFPCLGNHDYSDATPSPQTYLAYFDLPGAGFTNTSGNERYYDFVEGPIHFFVLNSNSEEPDGTTSSSKQAQWLKTQLAASTSTWKIVYDHHPPYSSDLVHGPDKDLEWPFAAWGANAVLSGHAHVYERIEQDGIPYFVNGLGGASRYAFGAPVTGSQVRYASDWGAQKVTVTANALTFEFWNEAGELIDSYALPARR